MPIIDDNEEIIRMPCIYYLVWFEEEQIKALLDSGSEINVINSNYAWKLWLKIWKTNVGAQKIDGSALETFEIVIANFQVKDKASRLRFFQEIFLIANTKFEVILKMLFLKISNTDILFNKETLTWKSYITNKALPTTKQVQIVDPKEFIIAVLNIDSKTFIVHVVI